MEEMVVDDSGGGRWDFLDWVGPDTSSCIFQLLDDPADLARAAAVSRSWRRFGSPLIPIALPACLLLSSRLPVRRRVA
jgi:hypothetical protein